MRQVHFPLAALTFAHRALAAAEILAFAAGLMVRLPEPVMRLPLADTPLPLQYRLEVFLKRSNLLFDTRGISQLFGREVCYVFHAIVAIV